MTDEPESDVMTASDGGKTYVVSQSLQDALAQHSEEMAGLRRTVRIAAAAAALALLGLLAMLLVKWDTVMAVLGRMVG